MKEGQDNMRKDYCLGEDMIVNDEEMYNKSEINVAVENE